MNGEIEVVRTESVIFPVKPHEQEVSEVKSMTIEETIVSEVRTIETQEARFARLKKSLRKRSRSIL
jgi:hypothetical protein